MFLMAGLVHVCDFVYVSTFVVVYCIPYGRKSADCTKHENDVILFVFLATVFGNLEFLKVQK